MDSADDSTTIADRETTSAGSGSSSRTSPGSETQLSMESAAIGMAITLPDGRLDRVNGALCRVLGYSPDEMVGRTFADFTYPDDLEPGRRALSDLRRGLRDSYSQRKRYVTRSGDPVWLDLSVTAVRDDTGKLLHMVAQMVNVTAEVYNLEALSRTVERFRKLAENATDVVFEVDRRGLLVWVSPSITSVLGWDPDLLIGTGATALIDPSDAAALLWLQGAARSGGNAADTQARFRTTHGDVRYMAAKSSPITSGKAGASHGAVIGLRDITDEHAASRSLEHSERLFRLSLLGAPHGIALADVDGVFTQANPALCELLGVSVDEVAGHRIQDFLHPEDDLLPDELGEGLAAVGKASHEHRLISKNRTLWVEHSVALLRDDDGNPELYVHQFSDQTRTRQLQQNLAYQANLEASSGAPGLVALKQQLLSRIGQATTPRPGFVGVFFCSIADIANVDSALAEAATAAGAQADARHREALLDNVAERIAGALRSADEVSRSGDEFVVLCECDGSPGALEQISERIRAAVSAPVTVGSRQLGLRADIGIALTHPDEGIDDLRVVTESLGAGPGVDTDSAGGTS